jgi:hypothetical protein
MNQNLRINFIPFSFSCDLQYFIYFERACYSFIDCNFEYYYRSRTETKLATILIDCFNFTFCL